MQSKISYSDKPALEYLFHPRSIAIVGVSSNMEKWNSGREFLESLICADFKGKLYPVGLDGSEIYGLTIYPSIKDVPDTVDYVILAIPAQYTPQLITDCADKGVKAIHMFTAGFSEIGDEEERQLESQIATIARQNGIRIIGPNCLGLHYPKAGLAFHPELPTESGSIGFCSQSGGNADYAIYVGGISGVYFSKVISYGNACDLNEADFLEYLTHDPESKIITIYIEGVKDGRRFFQALRQAAKVKPVIVYKGGTTESGSRAAASHTGTIAGSATIWSSLLRQAGAIQVDNMEEMLDMILLFNFMSPPKGKNTAVLGIGGGFSVLAADACSNAGLTLPRLPTEMRQQLEDIYTSEAGGSFKNPVDMYWQRPSLFQQAIKMVADYDQFDLLMIHIPFLFVTKANLNMLKEYTGAITNLAEGINNRTAVVLHSITSLEARQVASEVESMLHKAGFAVYPSVSRAANAMSKFLQYHQQHQMKFIKNNPTEAQT